MLGERDIEKKRSTWCKENKLLNEEKYSVQGEEAIEWREALGAWRNYWMKRSTRCKEKKLLNEEKHLVLRERAIEWIEALCAMTNSCWTQNMVLKIDKGKINIEPPFPTPPSYSLCSFLLVMAQPHPPLFINRGPFFPPTRTKRLLNEESLHAKTTWIWKKTMSSCWPSDYPPCIGNILLALTAAFRVFT